MRLRITTDKGKPASSFLLTVLVAVLAVVLAVVLLTALVATFFVGIFFKDNFLVGMGNELSRVIFIAIEDKY